MYNNTVWAERKHKLQELQYNYIKNCICFCSFSKDEFTQAKGVDNTLLVIKFNQKVNTVIVNI